MVLYAIISGGTTPPTPTLQWVEYNNGDTIPSDLEIYGISGTAANLYSTFGETGGNDIVVNNEGRNKYIVHIGYPSYCYETSDISGSETVELIFSNIGCSDHYSQGATVGGTIKLYIYM